MALVSPGVEITVTDESQYLPTGIGSIPLVVVATAENKTINGLIAAGTLATNAGKVYGITSQRELATTFGLPHFRRSAGNTPLHGDELNEYGLMATYSALGLGNRAWVLRADIDLDQLEGSVTRPTGSTVNGTAWFDVGNSQFGIFEFDTSTAAPAVPFNSVDVDYVITSSALGLTTVSNVPVSSLGSIGDYAVVAYNSNNALFKKLTTNIWERVGSTAWSNDIPVVTGTASNVSLASSALNGNLIVTYTTTGGTSTVVPVVTTTTTGLHNYVSAFNTAVGANVVASLSSVGEYLQFKLATGIANVSLTNGTGSTIISSLGITAANYYRATVFHGSYNQQPDWRNRAGHTNNRPTGSVWIKTSAEGGGANFVYKKYNSVTQAWVLQSARLFASGYEAIATLDAVGGGQNIAAGTTFVRYLPDNLSPNEVGYRIFSCRTNGATSVTAENTTFSLAAGAQFIIKASVPGSATPTVSSTITLPAANAAVFVTAVQAAALPNVVASIQAGAVRLVHTKGGIISIDDLTGNVTSTVGFTSNVIGVSTSLVPGTSAASVSLSNWTVSIHTVSSSTPLASPADGQFWYYNDPTVVDIMINDGSRWKGYGNITADARGYNLSLSDPNGPIVSASEPIYQSRGSAYPLADGDLWLDTSDLENFPRLARYDATTKKWNLVDNTDRLTQNGILFADARWDKTGTTNIISGTLLTAADLWTSDYVDEDCPNPALYPRGMLLFNTRRSGFNVKKYVVNYFNSVSFPTVTAPRSAWVTELGFNTDNRPKMGHHAQRNEIVQAMKAAVDSNLDLREEGYNFNILCSPGYPELIPNLILLNNDRSNTGFVIGDTPMTLPSSINSINAYSQSVTTSSEYLGLYYPSALTTDLSGNEIIVPASHMMLRTFIYNDNISYQWFAPAGTRRGLIDNALAIGYINTATGNFVRTGISNQLRDALYETRINPITLLNGVGIVAYGQKTRAPIAAGVGGLIGASSAMDRINVSRLVNYLRTVLAGVANQFLFEPNDKITRDQIKQLIESVMNDLIAKRGLYDYIVVCDETNNTSDRIARNELYVDIAIEPMKSVEFIYIPIRLKNPGSISGSAATTTLAI